MSMHSWSKQEGPALVLAGIQDTSACACDRPDTEVGTKSPEQALTLLSDDSPNSIRRVAIREVLALRTITRTGRSVLDTREHRIFLSIPEVHMLEVDRF